jgi:putative transposase
LRGPPKTGAKPAQRRALGPCARVGWLVSERRACQVIPGHRSARLDPSVARGQRALRWRLRDLAAAWVRDGYRRLYIWLQREGWRVNHKQVYRLYRLEGLSFRLQQRKKRPSHLRVDAVDQVLVDLRDSMK